MNKNQENQELFTDVTLKGFIVPSGHILRIATKDGEELVKLPGQQSGANFKLHDVVQGLVPGWVLEEADVSSASENKVEFPDEIYEITQDIRNNGGDLLFVGGIVRDSQLGIDNKDIDVEVYNLPAENLIPILSQYGKVDQVGVSFGVIKLTTETMDYDFSLPRRENKEGAGHKGFVVTPDHTMTPKEAASRRDFTFNGLALTPEGQVLDFFNGLADLKDRRLRHISEKFAEDPLRVLRGFQFAARFNMTMDDSTAELASSLKSEYRTLAKERVWGEWQKWATKGAVPSAGLRVLDQTGWIDFYPELKNLKGIMQDDEWHPEGDVWEHTLHVVDGAAEIADRDGLVGEDRLVLLLAALCHDLGKPSTTVIGDDGRWHAPRHPQEGVDLTKSFLRKIGASERIVEKVCPLVAEHMAHLNDITPRAVRRLALRLDPTNIEMLVRVIEADHSGRPPLPKELPKSAKDLLKMAHQVRLGESKPKPILTGKHLLELATEGKIPEEYATGGPHFGTLLNSMFEKQLEGDFEDEASAVEYLLRMFSLDYKNAIVFTGTLEDSKKEKLMRYAQTSGMDIESIWQKGEEYVRKIVE